MKLFVKLLALLILLAGQQVYAVTFKVVVLPVDLMETKENYYAFPEVSEIISNDVIAKFNSSVEINSPDLYAVRTKIITNPALKNITSSALKGYKYSNKIDYNAFKQISNEFSANSVLLISSYAVTNQNSIKRSLWEIMQVSTEFDISYPFKLNTNAVLIDNVNGLVMWSGSYSKNVGNVDDMFQAQNYAQANSQLENIKMYSKNIAALDIVQNVMLRFFPKSIRAVESTKNSSTEPDGSMLRYERTIPVMPKTEKSSPENDEGKDNYGEMIFGI